MEKNIYGEIYDPSKCYHAKTNLWTILEILFQALARACTFVLDMKDRSFVGAFN